MGLTKREAFKLTNANNERERLKIKRKELRQKARIVKAAIPKPPRVKQTKVKPAKIIDPEKEAERIARRKESARKWRDKKKAEPFYCLKAKVVSFVKHRPTSQPFTYKDVLAKFGDSPRCYLTGKPINYGDPATYQLDHVISLHRGGDCTLENLQLCNPMANQAKREWSETEFIELCKTVAKYRANG